MQRGLEAFDMLAGAAHAISAPPPKLKKLRKKLDAANAIDRPKMIWISRRKPPAVSPNARVRPVMMMMITAMILATGPWTEFQHLLQRLFPRHAGARRLRAGGDRESEADGHADAKDGRVDRES